MHVLLCQVPGQLHGGRQGRRHARVSPLRGQGHHSAEEGPHAHEGHVQVRRDPQNRTQLARVAQQLAYYLFRYLKKDKLVHPPPLMEGEAIASRVLELGPSGAKFLGPVIIEVPHFAALRGKEREIVILRSDNGETWKEHTLEATEDAVQDVLQESFDRDGETDLRATHQIDLHRHAFALTSHFQSWISWRT